MYKDKIKKKSMIEYEKTSNAKKNIKTLLQSMFLLAMYSKNAFSF
jgi:hypothetical protein